MNCAAAQAAVVCNILPATAYNREEVNFAARSDGGKEEDIRGTEGKRLFWLKIKSMQQRICSMPIRRCMRTGVSR